MYTIEDKPSYWTIPFVFKDAGGDIPGATIWKLRPELYDALKEFGIARYEWTIGAEYQENDPYTREDFLSEVFMSEDALNRLTGVLQRKKNIILKGAPGVGKTFTGKTNRMGDDGRKGQQSHCIRTVPSKLYPMKISSLDISLMALTLCFKRASSMISACAPVRIQAMTISSSSTRSIVET